MQPDEHAQSLLFDQIADDFVFLFTQTRGNKSADEIFMVHHVSQACVFICGTFQGLYIFFVFVDVSNYPP